MANPWFRLYAEFADDPKVLTMPEVFQLRLVKLMCLRCKDETLDETFQAFQWRISADEMTETKKLFLARGFIDEEWNLLNWNRRQFISDSSTERVRQYRERKKRSETLPKQENPEDFDTDETGGNVTVTAPEQIQSRTETDSEADSEQTRPSARELARVAAKKLSQAVNPEAHEDLSEWVDRIAVAYPKNRLKNLGPLEVYPADKPSIVDAILLEAGKGDVTTAEAAEMLLRMVEALGDTVPREQWQYLPRMTAYFAEFEYRRDPETFKRARGGASNGKRRGTEGNAEALREFLEQTSSNGSDHDGATGKARGSDREFTRPAGGRVREDAELDDLPALHGGTGRLSSGGDHPGVQPSDGGVPFVLPKPSYPPRVQWPRRNG